MDPLQHDLFAGKLSFGSGQFEEFLHQQRIGRRHGHTSAAGGARLRLDRYVHRHFRNLPETVCKVRKARHVASNEPVQETADTDHFSRQN